MHRPFLVIIPFFFILLCATEPDWANLREQAAEAKDPALAAQLYSRAIDAIPPSMKSVLWRIKATNELCLPENSPRTQVEDDLIVVTLNQILRISLTSGKIKWTLPLEANEEGWAVEMAKDRKALHVLTSRGWTILNHLTGMRGKTIAFPSKNRFTHLYSSALFTSNDEQGAIVVLGEGIDHNTNDMNRQYTGPIVYYAKMQDQKLRLIANFCDSSFSNSAAGRWKQDIVLCKRNFLRTLDRTSYSWSQSVQITGSWSWSLESGIALSSESAQQTAQTLFGSNAYKNNYEADRVPLNPDDGAQSKSVLPSNRIVSGSNIQAIDEKGQITFLRKLPHGHQPFWWYRNSVIILSKIGIKDDLYALNVMESTVTDPSTELRILLAQSLLRAGKAQDAVSLLKEDFIVNPGQEKVRDVLSRSYLASGDPGKALRTLKNQPPGSKVEASSELLAALNILQCSSVSQVQSEELLFADPRPNGTILGRHNGSVEWVPFVGKGWNYSPVVQSFLLRMSDQYLFFPQSKNSESCSNLDLTTGKISTNLRPALQSPVVQNPNIPTPQLFSQGTTIFDRPVPQTLRCYDVKTGSTETISVPNLRQDSFSVRGLNASATHVLLSDFPNLWSIDLNKRQCVWTISLPALGKDEGYNQFYSPNHLFGVSSTHCWTLIAKKEGYELSRWMFAGSGQSEKSEILIPDINDCCATHVTGSNNVLVIHKANKKGPWQRTLINVNTGKVVWERNASAHGFWNCHFSRAILTHEGIWAGGRHDDQILVLLDEKDGSIRKAIKLTDHTNDTTPFSIINNWSATDPYFLHDCYFFFRFPSYEAMAKLCPMQISNPEQTVPASDTSRTRETGVPDF